MKYNSVALLLGYNQVFFHPEVLLFLPIYFPHILFISGKPILFSWEILDSSIFYVHLSKEKQGRSMPFEIVCICVWLLVLFQKHVILQLIHICINGTCKGFMS